MDREATQSNKISVEIKSPLGFSVPMTIDVPDSEMTLPDIVPAVQSLTNAIVSRAIAAHEEKGAILSCRAGCDACCHQLILLSVPEALFLMAYIRDLQKDRQRHTIDRFNVLYNALSDADLYETLEAINQMGSAPNAQTLVQDYFELGAACPFLEDGSCSIHEIRPIVCREYNVLSDPKNCADPYHRKVDAVYLVDSRVNVLGRLAAAVLNRPSELIPMPLIFDWYKTHHRLGNVTRHASWFVDELLRIIERNQGKPPHQKDIR